MALTIKEIEGAKPTDIPHEGQPDVLIEAEQVFAPKKLKSGKAKPDCFNRSNDGGVKASATKEATRKKAA